MVSPIDIRIIRRSSILNHLESSSCWFFVWAKATEGRKRRVAVPTRYATEYRRQGRTSVRDFRRVYQNPRTLDESLNLSLIHISEPTRRTPISYAVFCL